jgi:hypothetical protein
MIQAFTVPGSKVHNNTKLISAVHCALNVWLITYNYNLFISDEDEYGDDNDELKNRTTIVRRERYATRLYIPLLISKYSEIIYFEEETAHLSMSHI